MLVMPISELPLMRSRCLRRETAYYQRACFGLGASQFDIFHFRTLDEALTFRKRPTAIEEF